ncbi:MAG: hypothetical protein AB7R69_03245 [Candidatus Babeliales bacterium]
MTIHIILGLILFLPTYFYGLTKPYDALIAVPVADLAGQSLQESPKIPAEPWYKKLAICGKKGEFACPRVHQALFGEQVTVLEEKQDEVFVKIYNFFYEKDKDSLKYDTFWTLKKNIVPLEHLKKHTISLEHIPPTISYTTPHKKHPHKVVTLLKPFRDTISGYTFSVGTRFVQAGAQEAAKTPIYILDPKTMRMHIAHVPSNAALCTDELSGAQKRKLFVLLCRQWAQATHGFVPYVWGGCSLTHMCKEDSFAVLQTKDHYQKPVEIFKRHDVRNPLSGFDCAGLIARAAQTAGLPYYYKNTTTLSKNLKTYTQETKAQNGDLMWIPGHVMVIGSIEKNTIIEARHYSHGYGKVHEIPIDHIFKDIKTVEELKQAYLKKEPLLRLDKSKTVIQTIKDYKLLEFIS